MNLTIESTSVETLGVTLRSEDDPTGGTVEFSLVDHTATDPGTWEAGTWDAGTPWNATSGKCRAITPTIGGPGAALIVTEGEHHHLYARINGGPVKLAAKIRAT